MIILQLFKTLKLLVDVCCLYSLQLVFSRDFARDIPGLCHDQRLQCDWMVWMVSLLQGVLWPQWSQRWTHPYQKSEPVPNWRRKGLSRIGREGVLQLPGRQSSTLHCVSTGQKYCWITVIVPSRLLFPVKWLKHYWCGYVAMLKTRVPFCSPALPSRQVCVENIRAIRFDLPLKFFLLF